MLVLVTACSTMQPVAQPRDFIQTRQPAVVWLSHDQQAMISMDAPRLVGDSVVGFVEGEYTEIALSRITGMQAKQYSRSRTTGFILGLVGLTAAVVLTVTGGHGANPEMDGEDDIGILPIR